MPYHSAFRPRDGGIDVAMTPMIDVVFMLLIFFVWTASFQVAELILPSSLVTQNEGQGVETDPEMEDLERVVVRIAWDGSQVSWTVNEVPVASFEAVRQRLQQVASIKSTLPVLVDPMPAVPLGHVIDVYDVARETGFANVQFATPAA